MTGVFTLKTSTSWLFLTAALLLLPLTGCPDNDDNNDKNRTDDRNTRPESDDKQGQRLENKAERLEDRAERTEMKAEQSEERDAQRDAQREQRQDEMNPPPGGQDAPGTADSNR